MASPLETARASLVRMQQFNADDLVRQNVLGSMNFEPAVAPARRLVRLYGQLSDSTLDDFPDGQLDQVRTYADADYTRVSEILAFDLEKDSTPSQTRAKLIQQLKDAYAGTFTVLSPLISYGVTKSVDYKRLETEGRASIQGVVDSAQLISDDLKKAKEDAEKILVDVRKAAAEQGVSQQAIYFKEEADNHNTQAGKWRNATIWLALGLGGATFASLWLHHIPGLDPDTPLRALQITTSKVLIFVTIAYVLILAARNYLAHTHNAVVNRHRQNALMTFKALVDAAKGEPAKDIILTHAASCIFAPQETAYTKTGGSTGLTKSVIELLPHTSGRAEP